MPTTNLVVELFAWAVAAVCWANAWKQGPRWFATVVVALLFSLGAEAFYLATEGPTPATCTTSTASSSR